MSDTIKNKFANYETAKMLKELGFDEGCLGWYGRKFPETNLDNFYFGDFIGAGDKSCSAPLWQDVKLFLWNKYNIWVYPIRWITNSFDYKLCHNGDDMLEQAPLNYFDSPITAEIEVIKLAVIFLHGIKT